MFTRGDVLSMVDALFHELDSSHRADAKCAVNGMMDRRERPKISDDVDYTKCYCEMAKDGDWPCSFCVAEYRKQREQKCKRI